MSSPIHSLLRFTLAQKVVFNLSFVLLILIGAFTLLRLPVERYPNIQFGKMYINTFLPGASPEEVENLVTKKIEEGLEDLEDIEFIRSVSARERSNVVIKFVDDSDYRRRYDDVRLKVLSMAGELPAGIEPPHFNFLDVNDWFPTISVNISGQVANSTLAEVAGELKILLAQIAGVKEVKLLGEFDQEFHLLLSPAKMTRHGVTYADVVQAISQTNLIIPAGSATSGGRELVVRVDEQAKSRDDLLAIVVRGDRQGALLRVADLVEDGYHSWRDPAIISSVSGLDCVTLQVLKSGDGNALFIAEEVRQLVAEQQAGYQGDGIVLTVSQDSSGKIRDSIRVLGVNLLLGVALVCLILWQFLGLRNAGLTAIGIPFAFLVTMVFMYLTGNSVNEVSLFAFILVSGIIVDDAIVVAENIYRHLQAGKDLERAVIDGTAEVFWPVIAATLTTVVAFLPMLVMTGMVGDFFAIIPKTIAFALAASLLECLLILPCHYLDFGPRTLPTAAGRGDGDGNEVASYLAALKEGWTMRVLRRAMEGTLDLAMRFRYSSLVVLGLAFGVAVVLFAVCFQGRSSLIRIQFFPDNYQLFYVELTGPPGTPVWRTHQVVKEVAGKLVAQGREMHESALGFAGFYINDDFSPSYGSHLGHVAVTLPDNQERRLSDYPENDVLNHLQYVRRLVTPLLPAGFQLGVRPEKDGPPAGKEINIRVLGPDAFSVDRLAAQLLAFLQDESPLAESLTDLQDDLGHASMVLRLRVKADEAARLGLSVSQVASLAAAVANGRLVGEMNHRGENIDIRLKLARGEDEPLENLLDLVLLELPQGQVRLGDVCSFEYQEEPGYLNRYQGQRAVTLTAGLQPGAAVTSPMVVQQVKDYYRSIREAFPGATLSFAGEHQSTQKSFLSLSYAFVIALLLIYLILAAQFRSYLQPWVIISAVIFALTGVIYGTMFSRTLFTINSLIAVVGVTGVVVNDSLVLVEFLNRRYLLSGNRRQALAEATTIRLRPILLTTLTTTLGLLPMALGIPEYSLIWGSMAMTFVTGLCTATFLTVIIIPIQWDILMGWRERAAGERLKQ